MQYREKMKAKRYEMLGKMKVHKDAAMANPPATALLLPPLLSPQFSQLYQLIPGSRDVFPTDGRSNFTIL